MELIKPHVGRQKFLSFENPLHKNGRGAVGGAVGWLARAAYPWRNEGFHFESGEIVAGGDRI